MNGVALRLSLKRMKVEPRDVHILRALGCFEEVQAPYDPRGKFSRDFAALPLGVELLETLVFEALDHKSYCKPMDYSVKR